MSAKGNTEAVPSQPSRAQNVTAVLLSLIFLGGVIGGGIYLRKHSGPGASGVTMQTGRGAAASGTVVKKVNDLSVTIRMEGGLRLAQNDVLIEFRKGNEAVDVGNVNFSLDMQMPGMNMHAAATVAPTGTPGQYRAKIKPEMAGDWVATLDYAGPQGKGRTAFPVNVNP